MLFRAYFDDSTEETVRIFTVGGFVAKDEDWISLDSPWLDFLNDLETKGISYFHATDCFAGANEFEGIHSPERELILDRALKLILSHNLQLVGYGLDEDAYKKFAPKAKRNEFGINRYVAAFEGAIRSACECTNPNCIYPEQANNICDFYIENSHYQVSAAEAVQQLKGDQSIWFHHLIRDDAYGDKVGLNAIPLLQVGDFGAFLANKHLINAKNGRIRWTKYYDALVANKRVWPIRKWDARALAILRGVQGLPDLRDDEF